MRLLVLIASLFLTTTALAVGPEPMPTPNFPYPENKAKLEPVPFILEIDAAKYALRLSYDCSHNVRECGGVIYYHDHLYYVTTPVTSNKPFGLPALEDFYKPETAPNSQYKIVADFHVHICNKHNADFSQYFSSSDIDVNDGLHSRGYMMSICDMGIRLYDPTQDPRDDIEVDFKKPDGSKGKTLYLTAGHMVDWVLDRIPPKKLPPRRGLDPQGHLPNRDNPHDMCPGQYQYNLADGTPLFCWGVKR